MFELDSAAWHQPYALCYTNPNTYGAPWKGRSGDVGLARKTIFKRGHLLLLHRSLLIR